MMNTLSVSIVLLLALLFSVNGGIIIRGDNDNGFNMIKNDRVLFNFTELHPQRTNGLTFKKISQYLMDKGFAAAIATNGDLYYWGTTDPTNVFPLIQKLNTNNAQVVDVSTSSTHVLYVTSDKKVFCFGDNTQNQCGNALTCTAAAPCAYGDGSLNAVSVKAGDFFSIILTDNGEVYVSGANAEGFMGTGTFGNILTPQKVLGAITGKNIKKIKSSLTHTVVQDDQGVLYSWGQNTNGKTNFF
jgi:alpha-tubulin suppressor-like RCC1 family protein